MLGDIHSLSPANALLIFVVVCVRNGAAPSEFSTWSDLATCESDALAQVTQDCADEVRLTHNLSAAIADCNLGIEASKLRTVTTCLSNEGIPTAMNEPCFNTANASSGVDAMTRFRRSVNSQTSDEYGTFVQCIQRNAGRLIDIQTACETTCKNAEASLPGCKSATAEELTAVFKCVTNAQVRANVAALLSVADWCKKEAFTRFLK